MNCSEANELFGDAIDGVAPSISRNVVSEHLRICPTCRRSYELEVVAKAVVKSSCHHFAVPTSIVQIIVAAIEQETRKSTAFLSWTQEIFTTRRLIPTLLASTAIALFLILFSQQSGISVPESDAHTASNDVIFQSLQNFARLQKGEFLPARIATKAEDVHQYLDSSGMDFAVVHTMDCCKSYGATLSEYDGIKLAHVVYTLDGDVMYVYQVKKANVLEGSSLVIPPAARTALKKTGWYTDPNHPDCNVVLWISNETLCAAVSSMKKDEMLAMLNQN